MHLERGTGERRDKGRAEVFRGAILVEMEENTACKGIGVCVEGSGRGVVSKGSANTVEGEEMAA
jgi:hypothetical protein